MGMSAKIKSHGFEGETKYFRICDLTPDFIELEIHNSKDDRFGENWKHFKKIQISYPEGHDKFAPTDNPMLDLYEKLKTTKGWDGLEIEILENFDDDDSGFYS